MKIIATAVLTAFTLTGSVAPRLTINEALDEVTAESTETVEVSEVIVEAPKVETVTRWVLPGASNNEAKVLAALQERGITDRAALATVLGNIKQESRFHSNICEGGARIAYGNCHRGGYGLIQWTTQGRYDGLGRHARRVGHSPSTVEAQVSYLFTEVEWKAIEGSLRRGGMGIGYYMRRAYRWLGWGHHGRRTQYSHEYYSRLVSREVPK